MFRSLYQKLLQTTPSTVKNVFLLPQSHPPKFSTTSPNKHPPTVSYLVTKFGLPLDSAIEASHKIKIRSTDRADSVLHLFHSYGFTQSFITKLVQRSPSIVLADPIRVLKPKLEFLESLGYSKSDVAQIVHFDRPLLFRSLSNHIVPTFTLWRKFLDNAKTLLVLKRMQHANLSCVNVRTIEKNVQFLKDRGVPDRNIGKLFILNAVAVLRKADRFMDIVRMTEEMKFQPAKLLYVTAISVIARMGKLRWERKVEVYKSFGWSDEDIAVAFKAQPYCMIASEKKIKILMDFYLNKLGLKPADVVKYPNLMMVSLEDRLIPRCSVIEVLLSHGLLKKDSSLMKEFVVGKPGFDKRYVDKYQGTFPEVLKAYNGELGYPRLEVLRAFYT